jgi:thiol:disulfide interchange protein DsbC
MTKTWFKSLIILALASTSVVTAYAQDVKAIAAIETSMATIFKGKPKSIKPTVLNNLYEVQMGSKYYYVSNDGRYLFDGDMYDLSNVSNLTEARRDENRQQAMKKLDESSMIVYKANGDEKHVVTVFTDIDCGYCRKLHSKMDEMNELGITVRYMAYPRAGVDSDSYKKTVGVWCADDQKKAMDIAKRTGQSDMTKNCKNPVVDHMMLGGEFGVTGTPAILLSNGTMIPGYQPPKQLLMTLNRN